jgi:hypothetical protein
MVRRFAAVVAVAVAAAIAAPSAWATHTANVFAGKWNTAVGSNGGGYANFSVIDSAEGASRLQEYNGTPCTGSTTYYSADYSDGNSVGRIFACTVSPTRLVGRYRAPSGGSIYFGGIDITANAAAGTFSGTTSSDDFGTSYSYTGTFAGHFPTDGCCPSDTPPPRPPSGGGGGSAPGGGVGGGDVAACGASVFTAPTLAHAACEEAVGAVVKARALVVAERLYRLYFICLSPHFAGSVFTPFASVCTELGQAALKQIDVWSDPPDARYREVRLVAVGAGPPLRIARSSRLKRAAGAYARALKSVLSASKGLATAGNRFATARHGGTSEQLLAQAAAGKLYSGLLVKGLGSLPASGKALASALRAAGAPSHFSRSALRRAGRGALRHVHGRARKRAVSGVLKKLPDSVGLARTLGAAFPTESFGNAYLSITLPEVAALVSVLRQQGAIPSGSADALSADLAAAANAGDDAARGRAVAQFIDDARNRTPGSASTLLAFAGQALR